MEESYQLETLRLETEHWWYRARRRIILDQLRRFCAGRGALRILDVGCGAGTLLRTLGECGEVIGLDSNPHAAAFASGQSSCEVRVGSVPDAVPADLGQFDLVCLFDVIEHLDDDVAALRCAHRLLRLGGALFVTVPAMPTLYGIHDEINEHRRRYTRTTLIGALCGAGFEEPHVSYFNMLLSPALIPAIRLRNHRRSGHNFEIRTRLDPMLERLMGLERYLLRHVRLPFGLSLLAWARAQAATVTEPLFTDETGPFLHLPALERAS